jgi:hypothetical protein
MLSGQIVIVIHVSFCSVHRLGFHLLIPSVASDQGVAG